MAEARLEFDLFPPGCERMSSAACFSNHHLHLCIVSYLDCLDLARAEQVSRSWQAAVLFTFSQRRQHADYKLHTFKTNNQYKSNKDMCSRVYRARHGRPDSMLLIGGSFGSPHGEPWRIDGGSVLSGSIVSSLYLPVDIGSAASTIDASGKLLLLGGWAESEEEVLDTVYSLEMAPIAAKRDFVPTWQVEAELPRPVCFPAAERTIRGDVVLVGGGDSPYRGGNAFAECLLRRYDEDVWQEHCVPDLHFARCGHSAVTTFNDTILVAGGYAGGTSYLNSVELLSSNLEQWNVLPPMSVARSGMAAVLGPDGAVYVTGGSPDGTIGHKGLERYDLREGKWTPLREMQCGRGYISGCVTSSDRFFVSGGLHNHKFQSGIEAYDFRTGLWTTQEVTPTPQLGELITEVQALMAHRDELLEDLKAAYAVAREGGDVEGDPAFSSAIDVLRVANEKFNERAGVLHRAREAAKKQLSVDKFKRACHVLVGVL